MRKLEGEFQSGELLFYLNQFGVEGTTRHCHDNIHTHISLSPITPLQVEAIRPDGRQIVLPTELGDMFWIDKGIQHKISAPNFTVWTADLVKERAEEVAQALNRVEGRGYCVFSLYGPEGYRHDPKQWTGKK